ncbi:MAG: efflux RND transporter periplasmic adaptor subunit [Campylobacterales bacterium]|nr:efflux RND transporter periplasmic adaptor subunit [Campylobacterales bacterium]
MKKLLLLTLLSLALNAKEIYATFDVVANQKANLAFSASGEIEKILVDIGSRVKKGDILAKLDNNDTLALLKSAKNSYEFAKKDLDRQYRVRNIIEEAKLDNYRKQHNTAKFQLQYQQSLFDKTFLKAPFDGVISDKKIEIGDVVSGMMLTTAFVIESHEIYLLLKFDSKYWQDVKVGDTFRYKLDGSDKEQIGTISKVYPTVDPKTRMMKAEVIAKDIPIGLFGTGYIEVK